VSRASDDTREQAVAALRKGLLAGRLDPDTFAARVDAAYRARTHDELATVTDDLPRRHRGWRALLDRIAPAGAPPPCLRPPQMTDGDTRVLGRSNTCDYAIEDPTVSSRHAQLMRDAHGWLIKDLGSLNGTRVNGWLVDRQRLRAGDTLALGGAEFVFKPPGEPGTVG
jgi:hypothetical protein